MQGEDKPAFFFGLMSRWVGDRDRLVAVIRYPGKVMLEEVGVDEVELDETQATVLLPPQITVLEQPTATRQAGQAWREESRG
jgi:hypothetical protein